MNAERISIHDLGAPVYQGSVQNLYAVPGSDAQLVCETTKGGSVFDVGSIFEIEQNDVARSIFRHVTYTALGKPETWAGVRAAIADDETMDPAVSDALRGGVLAGMEESGALTHHLGMLDAKTGEVISGRLPENPSRFNVVRRFTVHRPERGHFLNRVIQDYRKFVGISGHVVPLECLVRFGITSGSSIYRKYQDMSEAAKKAFEVELGAFEELRSWEMLSTPILDFTSKFEAQDRPVSRQEAFLMSGLTSQQFDALGQLALLGAWAVRNMVGGLGLTLWDLKWEFAIDGDSLLFVDTIDTDSIRATMEMEHDGDRVAIHFNKQSMRDYYHVMHQPWLDAVAEAKADSARTGESFNAILTTRQAEGDAPTNPNVDEGFLEIQKEKMAAVRDGITTEDDVSERLKACAKREIKFYEDREKFGKILNINRLPINA
ncbi:MAG: phosphoribosylaminoimidazolesuccinocarboxamide synthase [Verrucomicrobiota bacterium]